MFAKFGEFDSAEELNRAAQAQLAEGDADAVRALAAENGLDPEDAEDFIDGVIEELTTPVLAALGKLEVEERELQNDADILNDWINHIQTYCQFEPKMAAAVRKKGKSLSGCITSLMQWSLKNAKEVPKEICKACGITYKVTLGIPGAKKAKELIREYYLGGDCK